MRGKDAENEACELLRSQGLKIVARNWRWQGGEIDIIGKDGDTLVFVEVRARTSSEFGSPAETITPAKRAKLWRSAQAFLSGKPPVPVRFDVVAVSPNGLVHIPDAFREEDVRPGVERNPVRD